MNICDNLGDHLVGNVYVKVSLLKRFLTYVHVCVFIALIICSFNKGLYGKYIFLTLFMYVYKVLMLQYSFHSEYL